MTTPMEIVANCAQPATQDQEPQLLKEYSVKLAKKSRKCFSVMNFHEAQCVKFNEWKEVRMHRENDPDDDPGQPEQEKAPRFGAGSSYNSEARRRKFGNRSTKGCPENRPWILDAKDGQDKAKSSGKKFKGRREGGIGANSSYYVFVQGSDDTIEVYPVKEWYKFQPMQRYKTLNAEEAEAQFERRGKLLNYFSVMVNKRLRDEEEETAAAPAKATADRGAKRILDKTSQLKISEMDDLMDSDDESEDEDGPDAENSEPVEENGKKRRREKGKDVKKTTKKKNVAYEAFEESDDGDDEGRERDYISDSSMSESELESQKEIKSVAEEKGLRRLLDSADENDDDEAEEEAKENEVGKEKRDDEMNVKEDKDKGKGKGKKPSQAGVVCKDKKQEKHTKKANLNASNSQSNSNQDNKDPSNQSGSIQPKQVKLQLPFNDYIPGASESGITMDVIRRYLKRKPMTMVDLLKKFKSKKTGLDKEKIADVLTAALTKINPIKQKINGITYYSIKA